MVTVERTARTTASTDWFSRATADIDRAREIVDSHARTSLDFFKIWPPKSYLFSPDRRSLIAYQTALGTAVGLGDPVGPDDQLESVTREFLRLCSGRGWKAAFYQALPDTLPMYRKVGLHVLKLGEEAVVDVEHFCSVTAETKSFRYIRHRLGRDGYKVTRQTPPQPEGLLDEARMVSDQWLTLPGRRERGFALGRFDKAYLRDMPMYLLRDSTGFLAAFVNEIPDYRKGEAAVDMMRHRPEVPNSAMEYLFDGVLHNLKERGYRGLSLGLVPFSGLCQSKCANLEERLVGQIYEHANRFFSFKGLHRFKAKFEPTWEERFLIYENGLSGLVRTILAQMRLTNSAD
jgi:phosphatidylglycerol lysyltransferase